MRKKHYNQQTDRPSAGKSYTWNDAAIRWQKETTYKRTHDQDIAKLNWLDKYLRDCRLDEMSHDLIESVIAHKQNVKGSTQNRMLALIRAVLRKAKYEWEWPVHVPFIRMRAEPKGRIRWLTKAEAERLLNCLPPYFADIVKFALNTGLRRAVVECHTQRS